MFSCTDLSARLGFSGKMTPLLTSGRKCIIFVDYEAFAWK